ncbi:MAG: major capsid protein [Bifidobacterium sp.]|nr:major capsid protein [Bifidobacterium sp.]
MSQINTSVISPEEATGSVQGAFEAVSAQLPFNSILPDSTPDQMPQGITMDGTTVAWTANQRTKIDDKNIFRAWDAESKYSKTVKGAKVLRAEVQPIGKRLRISEADIARNGDDAFTHTKALEYFQNLAASTAFQLELARLKTVVDGKLSITERDLPTTFDFGRASDLSKNLTGNKMWSADGINPVEDIKSWSELVKKHDGMAPQAMVTTRKVMNLLAKNPQVISLATERSADTSPTMIKESAVREVLSEYAGIRSVLVADEAYDTFFQTNHIEAQDMFPEDTVLLLPGLLDSGIGVTALGPTAEARLGVVSNPGDCGLVGVVQDTAGAPPAYDVYVTGSALPVFTQPNSTFKATVTA